MDKTIEEMKSLYVFLEETLDFVTGKKEPGLEYWKQELNESQNLEDFTDVVVRLRNEIN